MFHFKQFDIEDNGATMKVGTDALLLGTLATSPHTPLRILDIGTGCGVIALIMAQRFPNAQIDAIDIDKQTADIASNNFLCSPWNNRLHAQNISIQDFSSDSEFTYDLIVSNPPFFSNSLRNENDRRRIARHDDCLPQEQLFFAASRLLSDKGLIAIIVPSDSTQRAISNAANESLICTGIIDICNRHDTPPKRTVLHFSKNTTIYNGTPPRSNFILRNADNTFSSQYQTLTEPFLL